MTTAMKIIRPGTDPVEYSLTEVLGSGTYGTVYLAEDKKGSKSAIKVIDIRDLEWDTREMANFTREVDTLASLNHPNIIAYQDSWQDNTYIFIQTAAYCNRDLWNYVKRTGIPKEHLLRKWIGEIASALKHLHERKFLHRNVKPANVMVAEDLMLKLGDFGTARLLPDCNTAKTVIGTPYFMSPEMLRSQSYTTSTDIWSFGCLCYAISTLEILHEGQTFKEIVAKYFKMEIKEVVSQIVFSDGIKHLIATMLSYTPTKRPTAGEIIEFLDSCDGCDFNKLSLKEGPRLKTEIRTSRHDRFWGRFPDNMNLAETCPPALHYTEKRPKEVQGIPEKSDKGADKEETELTFTAQLVGDIESFIKRHLDEEIFEVGLFIVYQENQDEAEIMRELKNAIGENNYKHLDVFFARLRFIKFDGKRGN